MAFPRRRKNAMPKAVQSKVEKGNLALRSIKSRGRGHAWREVGKAGGGRGEAGGGGGEARLRTPKETVKTAGRD